MTHTTREAWLQAAIDGLRGRFEGSGHAVAEVVHALVSWPKGSPKAIGQCFHGGDKWSVDGTTYVTVSPLLADPIVVLDTLLHELVHAAGCKGHGPQFKKVGNHVGLTGKMTHSELTAEARADMKVLIAEIGPYPHVGMREPEKKVTGVSQYFRLECPNGCYPLAAYVNRRRYLAKEQAAPLCPDCQAALEPPD